MTIRKRGTRYHYDFMIRRQRYRGALPEARTKAEAQQAEAKIKNKIYERKFGKTSASRLFAEFVRTTYLPWAKATKRSSRDDVLHAEVFCRHFGNKNLSEIDYHMIEEGKRGAITVLSEYRQKRRHKFVTDEKRQAVQPAVNHC